MTLSIREVGDADRPAIHKVVEAAFARADEARLVDKLRAAEAIELDRVGVLDGEIIGYCAFSRVSIAPPVEGAVFGLAPVAVERAPVELPLQPLDERDHDE